jgi:hypothetical protein
VGRRLHRGALPAALLLALGAGVTGCGAGTNAQSYLIDPDNAEATVGNMLVRNLVMVKTEEAPAAGISGTFLNQGSTPDVLETIQIDPGQDAAGGQAGSISISPGLEVPAFSAVSVGAGNSPPLVVPNAEELHVGTFVTMTLTFREAGVIELQVPLEDAVEYYATIVPTAAATPAGTGTPGPGATGTPAPEPTAEQTTPLLEPGATPS